MSLAAGSRLGPYEIVAAIGAGGMGQVYKARDTRLERTVAIKVGGPQFDARFEREARAIAALSHPHICSLYDIGPDYLVMEYIEGAPIKGPMPVDQALPLALQIAAALAEAHGKGIVHRDLKPGNILLTPAGVKLLDFGLAKRQPLTAAADATTSLELTEVGSIVGTAAYMSPEQAEGKPVDARSDIFSFGLVLYEMLSGRKAFAGETAISTLVAILHQEPSPLDVPPTLARVIDRCLRKSPGERFQSMAEVIAALDDARSGKGTEPVPSIAVLPFANMSADKENEYFSDGLAEEIINALTQVSGLKVTARTSAFSFRGKDVKIADIARELGVAHVLEGSVRKAGSRIRVTAQLIKAADGFHVWSERYDRELTDAFAIQDEISTAIVGQLKISLAANQPLVKRTTTNPAAYEAFLEGRHHWYRFTPSGMARGREYFEKAVAIDPGFAPAYAGLAETYFMRAILGGVEPRKALPQMAESARKAIELDDTNADAHSMLALFHLLYEYDWQTCEEQFRRALELAPASNHVRFPYAYWYLRGIGRIDEATKELESILEQDPLAASNHYGKGVALATQRRYAEAAASARRALEIEPNYLTAMIGLASALAYDGRFEEAVAAAERLVEVHGRWPVTLGPLGDVYALAGRKQDAQNVIAELLAFAQRTYVGAHFLAAHYALLGERDAAFEWIAKAIDQREPLVIFIGTWRAFDGLRSDSRYSGLLRRMNLA